MHREGYGIIFAFAITALAITVGYRTLGGGLVVQVLAVATWLLTLLSLYFFRDPERSAPQGDGLIVAPADGKVVAIDEVEEPDFIGGRAKRISIFLSVLDVHVNRVPVGGVVRLFRYQPGKFHVASLAVASIENEQSIIGVEAPGGKILFKQIAGLIARRIVCDLREGHKVLRGERFGIIKFGSRMDVFMPHTAEIKVRLRQTVKAGESIIGEFHNE